MTGPGDGQPDLERALLALEAAAASRLRGARERRLVVDPDPGAIRRHLRSVYDFARPVPTADLVAHVLAMLTEWDLDSTHPRYFGLFNPPALPVTAAADALVAVVNPQLGTRTHSPAANEIERHVLDHLAARIGFPPDAREGHFTSGGQEANATAIAAALAHRFPGVPEAGLRSLRGQPRLYVSAHAHHSLLKAGRFLGLGARAVREIPARGPGGMDAHALASRIAADRAAGDLPFLVVATAGTTGTGAIDPLPALADLAAREGLWLHVDAAWGGAALLSGRLRRHLAGIERADSVTWDAHKWLDVPIGAGMLFHRHPGATGAVFRVSTGYVPAAASAGEEPYLHTAQWSRRFIGLKLFMALASVSGDGYARLVEHQTAMGERLRAKVAAAGWSVVNDTPLPLVCFSRPGLDDPDAVQALVDRVHARGRAWISCLTMPEGTAAVRACITSYDTGEADLDVLVAELAACAGAPSA